MSEMPHYQQPPQGQPGSYQRGAPYAAPKSKVIAAVLAFFLGMFGVHNFYLGYNGRGAIQLVMGLLGYGTVWLLIGFVLLVPLAIWVIAEFFMILFSSGSYSRSANGVPLD
jgi:TM2 domain-containing membrane protein YozV